MSNFKIIFNYKVDGIKPAEEFIYSFDEKMQANKILSELVKELAIILIDTADIDTAE